MLAIAGAAHDVNAEASGALTVPRRADNHGERTVLPAARLSRPSPPSQGQAARGRFASLDTAAAARGIAAIEEQGGNQGTAISAGSIPVRRAISVLLIPVTRGLSRSLADTRPTGQAT
jgi:hypothetical protein